MIPETSFKYLSYSLHRTVYETSLSLVILRTGPGAVNKYGCSDIGQFISSIIFTLKTASTCDQQRDLLITSWKPSQLLAPSGLSKVAFPNHKFCSKLFFFFCLNGGKSFKRINTIGAWSYFPNTSLPECTAGFIVFLQLQKNSSPVTRSYLQTWSFTKSDCQSSGYSQSIDLIKLNRSVC